VIIFTLMKDGPHLTRFKRDHWKVTKVSKGLKLKTKPTTKKNVLTVSYTVTSSKN